MNIDGSNPRMISGAWDRSPQSVMWKEDGNGLYFTAQDQGSQNLYFLPLAGTRSDEVQTVTRGVQMLTTSSLREGQGGRRAELAAGAARHRRFRHRRRPASSRS